MGVVDSSMLGFLFFFIQINDTILSSLTFGQVKATSVISPDFFQTVRISLKFIVAAILLITESINKKLKITKIQENLILFIEVALPMEVLQDIDKNPFSLLHPLTQKRCSSKRHVNKTYFSRLNLYVKLNLNKLVL